MKHYEHLFITVVVDESYEGHTIFCTSAYDEVDVIGYGTLKFTPTHSISTKLIELAKSLGFSYTYSTLTIESI